MSLASLLKKDSLRGFATATPATPATHDRYSPPTVATVATVAVANTPDRAVNDPTHSPENSGDLNTQQGEQVSTTTGTAIDVGTIRPTGLSPKLLAASLALDAQIAALGLLPYAERQHGHDPRGYP